MITETLSNLNNPFLSVQVFNRTVLNEVTVSKKKRLLLETRCIYHLQGETGNWGWETGRATSSFWEASVTWAANRKEAMEVLYPRWTLQLYFMWSFGTRGVLFVFPVRSCLLVPSRG